MAWLNGRDWSSGHPFASVKAFPQANTNARSLDPGQFRLWCAGRGSLTACPMLCLVLHGRAKAGKRGDRSLPQHLSGQASAIEPHARFAFGRWPAKPLRSRPINHFTSRALSRINRDKGILLWPLEGARY